jgi:hypothetical protein
MVIFRMQDHRHSQRPDFIYVGLARMRCERLGIRMQTCAGFNWV